MTADIHQVSLGTAHELLLSSGTGDCSWPAQSLLDSHPTPYSGPHDWACRQKPRSLRDMLDDLGSWLPFSGPHFSPL